MENRRLAIERAEGPTNTNASWTANENTKHNNTSNQTANNNLNAQTDFEGTMKLSSLQMDAGQYTIDVIDEVKWQNVLDV